MQDNETFIDLFPDADPEATARPSASNDSLDPSAMLTKLPRWQDDALEVRATLGSGGMGIVRLAHQPGLGRDVAVKTLKREHRTEEARWRVLQEAWAAGSLEHPHIVPVYGLGLDDADMPYIVMKRLEGDRFTDRLRDGGDLDDHLRVLEAVAQAVAFAHDKGVVHRDLKPDNVMIGAYEEVTLIDWGLAVTTLDGPDRRLPRASEQRRPAGTPSYMAPEQLAEHGQRPSPATDVYQLGGLLYAALHGRPPHGKGRLEEVIDSVRRGTPPIDPGVDPEARALLRRAMAHDPALRHPHARDFLRELRAYRTHRAAHELLHRAALRCERLMGLLDTSAPEPRLVHQEVGAIRFAVHEARSMWPEADTSVVDRGFRAAARWHLDRDEPGAAEMVLDALAHPDPALGAEVRAAVALRQEREEQRAAMLRDQSHTTGIRTRAFVLGFIGTVWVIAPLFALWRGDDLLTFHLSNAALLLLTLSLTYWARDSLGKSQLNRTLRNQLIAVPLIQGLVLAMTELTGGTRDDAVIVMLPAWTAIAVCNVALLGPVVLPMALGYAGAYVLGTLRPDWALQALAAANLVLLLNGVIPWLPMVRQAMQDSDSPLMKGGSLRP